MTARPRPFPAFLTVAVALLASPPCPAAIPAGQEAATHRQFNEKLFAFEQRVTVEAYKKVGRRDPRWDEAAIKFLEQANRNRLFIPGAPTVAEVEQLGKAALDAGCEDPMVLYHYGRILANSGRSREAAKWLMEAASRMRQVGYSADRAAFAIRRVYLIRRAPGNPQMGEVPAVEPGLAEAVADMIRTGDAGVYREGERGFLLFNLEDILEGLDAPAVEAIAAAAAKVENPDPVAALYLAGAAEHKRAWAARGTGFAAKVTPEGWRGFEEHGAKAADALTKAWELDKTVPEPAALMIAVSLGHGGLAEMRKWFDRAVAARLDHKAAYDRYRVGLMPKWHGSHEAMLAFGIECYETRRWDTDVPAHFLDMLAAVRKDQNDRFDVWRLPGIYEKCRETCERVAEHFDKLPTGGGNYRSALVGYALRTGHWADARRVVDQLGDKLDWIALLPAGLTPAEARDMAHAYTSAGEKDLTAGDEALAAERWADAAAAYDRAAEAAKDDAGAVRHARGEAQAARWRAAYDAAKPGEWVPLAFAPDLPGWHVHAGKWTAQPDGSVVTESALNGQMMWVKADFGTDMDVSLEAEVVGTTQEPASAGVLFVQGYARIWHSALVRPSVKMSFVQASSEWGKSGGQPAPVQARNRLFVSKRGNRVTLWVNGQVTHRATRWVNYGPQWDTHLAVGGHARWAGTTLRFWDLKVRRAVGGEPLDGPDAPVAPDAQPAPDAAGGGGRPVGVGRLADPPTPTVRPAHPAGGSGAAGVP